MKDPDAVWSGSELFVETFFGRQLHVVLKILEHHTEYRLLAFLSIKGLVYSFMFSMPKLSQYKNIDRDEKLHWVASHQDLHFLVL